MKSNLALSLFPVENCKAIRNSGRVKLRPLTAFIGRNGSPGRDPGNSVSPFHQSLDQAMVPMARI